MKYFLLECTHWELYYAKAELTPLSVAQKFVKNNYKYTSVEKFDKDKYEPFESHEIRNDEDIFIFHMPNNRAELWQIGSKVADYFGNIIPGL